MCGQRDGGRGCARHPRQLRALHRRPQRRRPAARAAWPRTLVLARKGGEAVVYVWGGGRPGGGVWCGGGGEVQGMIGVLALRVWLKGSGSEVWGC
eukprot:364068-Chlamydomonas_euryale.AAC.14